MFQFFFAFQVVETFLFYISITYLHQAGFEPAHPEIVGLKSTALDHSAIGAHFTCDLFFKSFSML
jgi:hypothetical protein